MVMENWLLAKCNSQVFLIGKDQLIILKHCAWNNLEIMVVYSLDKDSKSFENIVGKKQKGSGQCLIVYVCTLGFIV